ncbi:MAG: DUF4013 domain-containing protein [Thermoanaerobaculia bacterium]
MIEDVGLRRAIDASRYPLVRGGVLWILGLALLELVPHGGAISWILSLGVSIAILRSSIEGGKEMPRLDAFLPAGEFLRQFGRGLAATLIVLWPLTIVSLIKFVPDLEFLGGLTLVLFLAMFFFLYFLPAALVSLVRGDSFGEALTPVLLKQLIREGKSSYEPTALLLCIGAFFVMILVAMLNAIPHIGAVLGRAFTIWYQFAFARAFGVIYQQTRRERPEDALAPAPVPGEGTHE